MKKNSKKWIVFKKVIQNQNKGPKYYEIKRNI